MRPRLRLSAVLLCASVLATAAAAPAVSAAPAGKWRGKGTSMDRSIDYGAVTFQVRGATIRNLKIESVGVDGCNGLMSIIVPKLTIKGNGFSGAYVPVKGIDQIITVHGTFSGRTAKGTFHAGPLCEGAGRFTARAR